MGNPIKIALLAAALVAGPMVVSHPANAAEHVAVSIGGVAFGYNDGYWDRDHQWHRWHNRREAAAWRAENRDHYYGWRHDRHHEDGWHEERWWDHH